MKQQTNLAFLTRATETFIAGDKLRLAYCSRTSAPYCDMNEPVNGGMMRSQPEQYNWRH